MTQTSGPVSSGTLAERQFTDTMWRDLFGAEPGVVGDLDGSAYKLTLPTNSDTAQVGSTTQDSRAVVAGFSHKIPAGTTVGVSIPAAVGSDRTDVISLRYDPANTGAPGPVRLHRIEGTTAAIPTYDASPPGVEDLPLWAVTRRPGQALSQAATKRLFTRIAPMLDVPPSVPLPLSSPLGTRAFYGEQEFLRELGAASTPTWRRLGQSSTGTLPLLGGWEPYANTYHTPTWHLSPTGQVVLRGLVRRSASPTTSFPLGTVDVFNFASLPSSIRPPGSIQAISFAGLNGGTDRYPVTLYHPGGGSTLGVRGMASGTGAMSAGSGFVSLDGVTWFV